MLIGREQASNATASRYTGSLPTRRLAMIVTTARCSTYGRLHWPARMLPAYDTLLDLLLEQRDPDAYPEDWHGRRWSNRFQEAEGSAGPDYVASYQGSFAVSSPSTIVPEALMFRS